MANNTKNKEALSRYEQRCIKAADIRKEERKVSEEKYHKEIESSKQEYKNRIVGVD